MKPPANIDEKFWSLVNKVDSGCWLWQGPVDRQGYGKLNCGREIRTFAHRHSYYLHNGAYDESLNVCHRCDVPACVNPEHLFLGTHQENMLDARAKGRANRLTEEEAKQIKLLFFNLGYTREQILERYVLSRTSLNDILNGRHWANV